MTVNRKYFIERTPTHIHVEFDQSHWVLSSAVLNGGLVRAKHIVNLKVGQNFDGLKGEFNAPKSRFQTSARKWDGKA